MNEIKNKIIADIKFAQDILGITLINEGWGNNHTKCACAIGCVLIVNHGKMYDKLEENVSAASHILGVSEKWINNFIVGFDADVSSPTNYDDAYKLGIEIYNETLPVSHIYYLNNLTPTQLDF